MNEDLLNAFLAVVNNGSFSAAAKKIHLSQPAISQRIKILEQIVKAKLFERAPGRSKPKLTEAGRLVYIEAQNSLSRWESLKKEIRARQSLEKGEITIGGGATAVSFLLPQVIADVLSRHPNLVIRVRESGSSDVIKRVINGELDFGIITKHNQALDSRLMTIPLISDQIVAVVGKGHSLAMQHGSVEPKQLEGERLVAYESSTAIGQVISEALESHNVNAKIWTELRSIQSILEIARLTSSIALVSQLSKSLWHDMTKLSCPRLEKDLKRELLIVWHSDSPPSAASYEFIHILRNSHRSPNVSQ